MVAGWPLAADNDVYFHLACGKAIWERGGPLLTDIFTYTGAGKPDESWHSWLSQAVFYRVHQLGGTAGLKTLNFLLVATTLFCVLHFVWKKTKSSASALLAGTVALLIHHHVQILRPLLFGETFFALTVFIILPWGKPLTPRRLAAGVGVAVAWANFHGSAVIVPFFFAVHALTVWRTRGAWIAPLAILVATFVNPTGYHLYPYALELTKVGKLAGGWEWASSPPFGWERPFGELPRLRLYLDVPNLVLIATLLWLALREGWKKAPEVIPFLLLPLLSTRHTVYLLFPAAVMIARALPKVPKAVAWIASVALLFTFRFYQSYDVSPSIKNATAFLRESRIGGNVLADPAWANYLTFALYPEVRVAYDTRTLLHRDFYAEARRLFDEYGKEAWEILVDQPPAGTQLLLLSASTRALDSTRWLEIYRNNHAVVAVRKSEVKWIDLAEAYYRQRGIPFSRVSGFSLAEVSHAAPAWLTQQLESNEWGRWPEPAAVDSWRRAQKKFYEEQIQLPKDLG